MEKGPSWEVNIFSGTQNCANFVEPDGHFHVHSGPPFDPIMNHAMYSKSSYPTCVSLF